MDEGVVPESASSEGEREGMSTKAIVQVRMGSTRLAGKVLKTLHGRTVLEHVISRIRGANTVSGVVVATTVDPLDDAIEDVCRRLAVACYRGSQDDVLERFYEAATLYEVDTVVRVTADDPLKDPAIVDLAVRLYNSSSADYVSNTIKPTYPEGLDIEVFSYRALTRAHHEATLPSEREHVTPYLWKNPEMFKLVNFTHSTDLSHLRWTLDNERDWAFVCAVYDELYDSGRIFLMDDVLGLLEHRPDLSKLNTGTPRNEGYLKSLKAETSAGGRRSE